MSMPWSRPGNKPVKGFWHWSAGHWNQAFPDYTYIVMGRPDGEVIQNYSSLDIPMYATWHENMGSIDIAAMCAAGAVLGGSMGKEPPTKLQYERLAYIAAHESLLHGIPMDYVHWKTHHEIALIDGYGPGSGSKDMRWDFIHDGDLLRGKAKWYMEKIRSGKK